MSRSRRRWWLVYGACAALALAALWWITGTVLALERAEQRARVEAAHQEALRLALWRMDSWFGPHLAREAARPFHEYLPFFAQERAYTRILNAIEPGEVQSPSPLLSARPELVLLYFQVRPGDVWSSPQVPEGNELDLAQATLAAPESIETARAWLLELGTRAGFATLAATVDRGEAELAEVLGELSSEPASTAVRLDELGKNQQEFSQRARQSYIEPSAQWVAPQLADTGLAADAGVAAGAAGRVAVGPLVPVWLGDAGAPGLCFVRRVRGGPEELLQGFALDWPMLREELLSRVRELLPAAELEPVEPSARGLDASGSQLATIPARLSAPAPSVPPLRLGTPARATLALSWIASLIAVVAAGWTLAASVRFGEKRSRFASTVTHELRTPLTTFRMYSEMLARGMVPEAKRTEYLATLERESARLSTLVENVLAYARLEEGRSPLRRERVTVGALVERARPLLERRAREAGAPLSVELDGVAELALETDPEAVQQILFNLVDNACKYAGEGAIELTARGAPGALELCVRDHGPGVPARDARSIFHPFERGGRDPADPVAGVGLGLALSRGLARDLGGDLTLDARSGEGATFRLRLGPAG